MTTRRSIFKTFAAAVCASAVDVLGLQPIPRFRVVFEAAYSATVPRNCFPYGVYETRFTLVDGEWQLASPPPNDCQPNPDYYTP